MNFEKLIKNYFTLNEDEKDALLTEMVIIYFDENRSQGFSTLEIILGIDTMIENAIKDEKYELSQAFLDIKMAIKKVIEEWDVTANEEKK